MKRLLTIALVASLFISACGEGGGGGGVAATVGDAEVTVADVRDFPSQTDGSLETTQFAQYLTALIQLEIVDAAAAEEFSIDPSEDEVQAELDTVLAEQAGGATLEEFAQNQNLSEGAARQFIRVSLIQRRLAEELGGDVSAPTDEEVQTALQEEKAGLTEVCARHVLVETADEAEQARQRLTDGEDFETVAAEMSVDTGTAESGGDLGCAPAGQYVPAFRDAAVDAEIDSITDPVESQFGFHVIQVYDRTGPSAEEVPTEEEIRETLSQTAEMTAVQEWLLEKLNEAEVSVDEEYGEWVTDPQPMVQPPAGSTTTSAGITPSSTTLPGG